MNEHIPLSYPHQRLTARLYRLADRHATVWWLTSPLWRAHWGYFIWRGRRDARRLGRVPVAAVLVRDDRPITAFLWSVDSNDPDE